MVSEGKIKSRDFLNCKINVNTFKNLTQSYTLLIEALFPEDPKEIVCHALFCKTFFMNAVYSCGNHCELEHC